MASSQEFSEKYSTNNKTLAKRYHKTLRFLDQHTPPPAKVLDLGISNMLGGLMEERGYQVTNTQMGQDLDLDYDIVKDPSFEMVTAFEIFEHLVAPFNLLREIAAPKLVASVPLKLWFTNAYWNKNDPWDRHYHEFEDRQFDMVLEKAGWEIKHREKWVSYDPKQLGFRPLLRRFTPRYYIVHCEKK